MRSFTSLKGLAAALSLAFLAGCASSGGSSDSYGSQDARYADGEGAAHGSDVSVMTLSGQRVGGTRFESDSRRYQNQADDPNIPEHRIIYFGFDRDQIRNEFAEILYDHAQYLKTNPRVSITLQGHTDHRGTREYNMALGERRANSVQRFLMMLDVPDEQMTVVSYGEERPAMRGDTDEAHAKNRRVVLRY